MSTEVAPDRIFELGQAFWASRVLFSAVELDILTVLAADGPLDADALRGRIGVHERGARDFFDALVALGLLQRDETGRYANGREAALYLDRERRTFVGGYLELCESRMYPSWTLLTEALRSGRPQTGITTDDAQFTALYADETRLAMFLRAMTGSTVIIARNIAARFPWQEYRTFMDVGTAEGALPVEITRAHAHLTGGGFDLAPVKRFFTDLVRAQGLVERLHFVAGDFLVDALPSADVLVMGRILHNWDLDTKKRLLAKAYAALPPGGALIVFERMIDDDRRANLPALLGGLNMLLVSTRGFDYTVSDCIGWMREVGFSRTDAVPLVAAHSMVVGRK